MIITENNCVDCAMPCVGGYCSYAESRTVCCDRCEESAKLFYPVDGEVLCRSCFIEKMLDEAETKSAEELLRFTKG